MAVRLHLRLISLIGVIVPRRLRGDWRQEWEAELRCREAMLADWERLDWRAKLDLTRRSIGAFRDAMWLQSHRWEDDMIQDLRFAVRMLLKNPGFTAVAVLSLALGIGSNAAMFSLINSVLIRPLPYAQPERLVRITEWYPQGAIAALQQQSRTMDLAAFTFDSEVSVSDDREAVRLPGSVVSANLFSLLGARPGLGRTFEAGEDRPGRDRLVVLSHLLWQNKFAGDPNIVGRPIKVDGVDRQVVGVMPAEFAFPSPGVQLWIPVRFDPANTIEFWNAGWMPLVGRLRPGVTSPQAQQELRALISGIIPTFPFPMPADWNATATVTSLQSDMAGTMGDKLLLLLCAVGCVLLIGCANVASLLLARTAARRREIAVRAALGAGRSRIVRQLLTESIVLAIAGGGLGLVVAFGSLSTLKSVLPPNNLLLAAVTIDWQTFTFLTALALLTGLAFGLAPALSASRLNLASAFKTRGQQTAGLAGMRLRSALIVCEVTLAVVLVISAGLLIKSLWRLTLVDPGFDPEHVLTVRVYPQSSSELNRAPYIAFYDDLLLRARGITGVTVVSAANTTPLSGEMPALPVEFEGHPLTAGQDLAPMLWSGAVTPDYFKTLRIPLLAGRFFSDADAEKSSLVVIVSASTAARFWPGESAIGKQIRLAWQQQWRTVVGVVGDVRQHDMSGTTPGWIGGAFYMPYPQSIALDRRFPAAMTLFLRTTSDSLQVSRELRRLVTSVNPNVPVSEGRTLEGVISSSTSPSRSLMWIFICFGSAALLLAAVGTYGVISYATTQRIYEMGVRVAMGATRGGIFWLVLSQSLRLVSAGLVLGVLISLALTRMVANFLYGVTATDPVTFVAVGALLMGVAVVAGYVPARRAASVDPVVALRQE